MLLGLLAVMGPVFSSSSWFSNSSSENYYKDSLKSNPVVLVLPAETDYLESSKLYESLQLQQKGLKQEVFQYALKGYKNLAETGRLNNSSIISICDYSQSSRKKRLYVINLETQKVILNTYVAHGKASGSEYATLFSNIPESHKSSLGFYITDNTYIGAHGLSLRINGIEKGFNDKANKRAIVIHGADYVNESFLRKNKSMGRSFGCPAVSFKDHKLLINTIRDGSCLFIYHPTKNYLQRSKIINS